MDATQDVKSNPSLDDIRVADVSSAAVIQPCDGGKRGGFVTIYEKITRFLCAFVVLRARNRRLSTMHSIKIGGKRRVLPNLLGENKGAPGGLDTHDDAADISSTTASSKGPHSRRRYVTWARFGALFSSPQQHHTRAHPRAPMHVARSCRK